MPRKSTKIDQKLLKWITKLIFLLQKLINVKLSGIATVEADDKPFIEHHFQQLYHHQMIHQKNTMD